MKNALMFLMFAPLSAALLSGLPAAQAAAPAAIVLQGSETTEQIQEAYAKALTSLLPTLGKKDLRPLQEFEALVHWSARPGAEAERLACSKAVGAALDGDAPLEAKVWMLKLTEFSARAELVPTLAKLLNHPEPLLRETARAALEHNAAPAAASALRDALAKATESSWQTALALALGARHDAASVPALAKLLNGKDNAVVEAALSALGKIASASAAKVLASAQQKVPEPLRPAAAEAWMKCAEQLLSAGKSSAAASIYRGLYQPQQPRAVRLAALVGTLKSAGNDAAPKVLSLLAGEDADARWVAAGFIPALSSGALPGLSAGIAKLPAETQIIVLGTLAERGEKSALPVALAFARSADEPTRIAGLTALSRLGDASAVPILVSAMHTGGNSAAMARESLSRVSGGGAEEAILAALQREADPTRRAALIEVLNTRGDVAAVPVLLQEAVADNATVRRPAVRALGKLAQAKEVPSLFKGLLKAAPGVEREDVEKAMALAAARGTEPGRTAEPVLDLYGKASGTDQLALLQVLGRIGGPKSLEAIKTSLASSDTATCNAGITAVANWPDSDEVVESELLALVQRTTSAEERAAALRAYVRVISMPSGLPETARLRKFQKAAELAERDQERNFVLERVAELRRVETLRFVEPYLDQPALAPRACSTVLALAQDRGLRGQNKAAFEQALNKVLAVCKDNGQLDRAKRYLGEK